MSAAPLGASALFATRRRLCSREHAVRVAGQICDAAHVRVAVMRSADPIQPYRVTLAPPRCGELVEIEVRD